MPVYRKGVDAQGKARYVRPPYKPEGYAPQAGWVAALRKDHLNDNPGELLRDPGGPFTAFAKRGTVSRDGKQYAVLLHVGSPQFGLEVELTGGALGEVRELSPEEAWALARAGDATASPPIEVEPLDP